MAAALEDPDEFIMTLMLRYGIHHWLAHDFESVMRRVSRLGRDGRGRDGTGAGSTDGHGTGAGSISGSAGREERRTVCWLR